MVRKIKRKTSRTLMRNAMELKKQECFNTALAYSDILGARAAADKFIEDVFNAQDRVWFGDDSEEWSESLQQYSINKNTTRAEAAPILVKRAFCLLAFFTAGTTHLIGKIVNQWNGLDPFRDELEGKE